MSSTNQQRYALEIEGLWAGYDRVTALEDVSFQLAEQQILGIIGPNGSGKSTLMKAVLGLVKPWRGQIAVLGQPAEQQRRQVGYVPQIEQVDWDFPVTVMDVVMMGRYGHVGWFKRPKKADRDIARDCLDKVKMLPFAKRQISNLSGGQQQRVFLARALAQESDIYFMDEPFAGVDAATESAIIALLHDLREKGKTLLVVHHDLPTARNYFDLLLLLNMRVVAYGETEKVFTYDLLQKTYGGRLTILSEVADAVGQRAK